MTVQSHDFNADVCQVDAVLDVVCPMHVRLGAGGEILNIGPTLRKCWSQHFAIGDPVFDAFSMLRPRAGDKFSDLIETAGQKLHLAFVANPETRLKGVLVPLGDQLGYLLTLSFGIGVIDAVRRFDLTSADFAHTDLAIEMLYLVEAKNAVMDETKKLNLRLQSAREAAEEQAFADALTGLSNRRALDQMLEQTLTQGNDFALMQIDLDHFKAVNDTLGHAAGDHVLTAVAEILRDVTRSDDVVTRIGGDEFVILFLGLVDRERLDTIASRVIERLEVPIPFEGETCRISASAGTTLSTYYSDPTAIQMLADADRALYRSKALGRAQHCFFKPEQDITLAQRAEDQ